ncbi:hypothetical protein E2C01_039819 [Portunus trituberculatus]|uniref:Uncharacterized protein n=1 Tax=Portunus trituberculatus TaxID=210409 RepID=A0A5B7FES8_PORTR|nr:hypothetical protein [Portunus trituberculatus]
MTTTLIKFPPTELFKHYQPPTTHRHTTIKRLSSKTATAAAAPHSQESSSVLSCDVLADPVVHGSPFS